MSDAAVYEGFVAEFIRGGIDWPNDEFKVMLVTGEYQPDQWSDAATAGEIRRDYETPSSGSYIRGGSSLEDCVVSGGFPDPITLQAGSVRWTEFTGSFRYAVIYRAADDLLVGYTDHGEQRLKNAAIALEYGAPGGICEFSIVPTSGDPNG